MLPYTERIYFSLIEQYYQAIWPLPVLGWLLAVLLAAAVFFDFRGRGRLVAGVLAAFWAWTGIVFHYQSFATLNFAAPLYAGGFVLQGLLLTWTGVIRGRVSMGPPASPSALAGLACVVLALLAYPAIDAMAAGGWTQARLAGTTPAPTVVLTLGLLAMTRSRAPAHLMVLPLLWVVVGTATAWVLWIPQDLLGLLFGGVVGIWASLTTAPRTAPGSSYHS